MPAKAGQIVIDISAGTGKFVQDMEVAKGKIREFGATGVSETKATRAAFKALEGDLFSNTKAAEVFAEKLLGAGNIAKFAFPVIGLAAFGGFVTETAMKVRDFFKEMAEAPEKIANAFKALVGPIRASNDELQIANDKLENDIAKLEGKPQNNLKLALDEARKSADDLADSLDKGFDSLSKLLKEQDVGFLRRLLGESGTGDLADGVKEFQDELRAINQRETHRLASIKSRGGNDKEITDARAEATTERQSAFQGQIDSLQDQIKGLTGTGFSGGKGGHGAGVSMADQARLKSLQGIVSVYKSELDEIGLKSENSALTNRKGDLTAGAEERKQAEETLLRLSRQLAEAKAAQADSMERIDVEENNALQQLQAENQINAKTLDLVREIYDTKRVTESHRLIEQYTKAIEELDRHFKSLADSAHKSFSEMWSAEIKDGVKLLEEGAKAAAKWAEQYNKINEQRDDESVRHGVAMAGINGNPNDPLGTLATQQAIQRDDIMQRYEATLKAATSDWERFIALDKKELELQKLQDEMEERTAAARRKNLADFLREMQGASKSAGEILYDSANSALDRVSDQFGKLLTGQKTSFGKMFQGIGEEMTKEATKSMMQKGLGALGKLLGVKTPGPKPDGTKGNPFHVVVENSAGNLTANPLAGIAPVSLPAALGGSGGALKGALGSIGGFLGKLFGKGGVAVESVSSSIQFMAGGGDADPGRIYGVAEAGEAELISPKNSSRITPISKLGGGTVTHVHHYDIDARGADLGAENRVARAVEYAHNSAVANGVRAAKEREKRTPRRS